MPGFLYPRKGPSHHLPHSKAFKTSSMSTQTTPQRRSSRLTLSGRHPPTPKTSTPSSPQFLTLTSPPKPPQPFDLNTDPGAPNPDSEILLYSQKMHHWTQTQLHNSTDISPTVFPVPKIRKLGVTTVISPLYPSSSSLYLHTLSPTTQLGSASPEKSPVGDDDDDDDDDNDDGGDGNGFGSEEDETPCNTPKNKRLRRRSTVVVVEVRRVKEEVGREGEKEGRLRTVELVRSLSCAAR